MLLIDNVDIFHGLFDKINSNTKIEAIGELGLIPLLDEFFPVFPPFDILSYFIDVQNREYN